MTVSIVKGVTIDGRVVTLKLNEDGSLLVGGSRPIGSTTYAQLMNAPDLLKTIEYADIGDPDNERVTSIVVSSSSLGISFTDAYTYAGVIGNYRITKIERTQTDV